MCCGPELFSQKAPTKIGWGAKGFKRTLLFQLEHTFYEHAKGSAVVILGYL